jgi:hypothetical protein
MSNSPAEPRSWQDPEPDGDRAVEELRRGIERVRSQVADFREKVRPEPHDEA